LASHQAAIVTDSKGLSRIERASAGKLSASPTADDCANIAVSMNECAQEIASGLPPDLDGLPRLGGFRLRGIAMTRLETFIDAAFAFAITMLVIATQEIPDDIETLLAAFRNVPAFVASIIVLGIFWRGHWLWNRRYGLEDGASIFISWAMIVTMLIYIYRSKRFSVPCGFSSVAAESVTCSARIPNRKSALCSRSSHWDLPPLH
jgi:Endosomal/lysosomal potassium channel TMEM175